MEDMYGDDKHLQLIKPVGDIRAIYTRKNKTRLT